MIRYRVSSLRYQALHVSPRLYRGGLHWRGLDADGVRSGIRGGRDGGGGAGGCTVRGAFCDSNSGGVRDEGGARPTNLVSAAERHRQGVVCAGNVCGRAGRAARVVVQQLPRS